MKNSTGVLPIKEGINKFQNNNFDPFRSNEVSNNFFPAMGKKLQHAGTQKVSRMENIRVAVNMLKVNESKEDPPRQSVANEIPSTKFKFFIKNMVSVSCKIVVGAVLDNLNISYHKVELGEVEVKKPLSDQQYQQLQTALRIYGFEIIVSKQALLVEKIKNTIFEMIHYDDELPKTKISNYLSDKLNYDYTYLSNRFSNIQGTTIEQYIIAHKIERIKELILYDELSLSEIAWKLHYSSAAHLSNQFKKITGLTPSDFKKMNKAPVFSNSALFSL